MGGLIMYCNPLITVVAATVYLWEAQGILGN